MNPHEPREDAHVAAGGRDRVDGGRRHASNAPDETTQLPPADEVHVWSADLAETRCDPGAVAAWLSPEERAAQARYVREVDRKMFALGRVMRRDVLGAYSREPPERLAFRENAYGKPQLVGALGLSFNVSHSGGRVVIAVASGRELGIDLEVHRAEANLDALAAYAFSPNEQRGLAALQPADRTRGFFACWSRKEAVVKALGLGLAFPLEAFDVSVDPGEPAHLLASRDARLDAATWSMHDVAVPGAFSAALVVAGSGVCVRAFAWSAAPPSAARCRRPGAALPPARWPTAAVGPNVNRDGGKASRTVAMAHSNGQTSTTTRQRGSGHNGERERQLTAIRTAASPISST